MESIFQHSGDRVFCKTGEFLIPRTSTVLANLIGTYQIAQVQLDPYNMRSKFLS
jgi:hypothetical protein